MTTDRELLHLAAKAAGIEIYGWIVDGNGVEVAELVDGGRWQPLHENQFTDAMGDALRLAVKLRIEPRFTPPGVTPDWRVVARAPGSMYATEESPDLQAATRRAVVRAAAIIGEDK